MEGKWLQGLFTTKPSIILGALKVPPSTLAPLQVFGCVHRCCFSAVCLVQGKPPVLKSSPACLGYCGTLALWTCKLLFMFDADQHLSDAQ